MLEGATVFESKTHGRPWPCEREGPARSVGGMERSGRFLNRKLQAWRQKHLLSTRNHCEGRYGDVVERFRPFLAKNRPRRQSDASHIVFASKIFGLFPKAICFCWKARQFSSQKPMAARGHVNGRGPREAWEGWSEAEGF